MFLSDRAGARGTGGVNTEISRGQQRGVGDFGLDPVDQYRSHLFFGDNRIKKGLKAFALRLKMRSLVLRQQPRSFHFRRKPARTACKDLRQIDFRRDGACPQDCRDGGC